MTVRSVPEPALTLRMLVDGAPGSGRSAVLRLLAEQNYVPIERIPLGTAGGAIEWLQFATGRFEGAPIRIEVFCGAGALARPVRCRARRLVDVVVLAVEATLDGAERARGVLSELQTDRQPANDTWSAAPAGDPVAVTTSASTSSPPALLLVAHKQDLPGALGADDVAALLGLPAEVPRAKTSVPQGGAAYAFALAARAALVRLRALDAAGFPRRVACDGHRLAASLIATPRRMPVGETTGAPRPAPVEHPSPSGRPAVVAPTRPVSAPSPRPIDAAGVAGPARPPVTAAATRRGALSRLIAALRGG